MNTIIIIIKLYDKFRVAPSENDTPELLSKMWHIFAYFSLNSNPKYPNMDLHDIEQFSSILPSRVATKEKNVS